MPRWIWFAPLTLLILAGAVWAFRWGWIAATITETDVINIYTQRYLSEGGATARLTDCTAVPGQQSGVWIVVRCVGAEARFDYPVDRFGRLRAVPAPQRATDAPET
ncbi:hypothetical protein So717_30420 [Roseobacter cerasinus]|uniref:Uncharacterized protein n=1 Tax=Roseobacter cerasinus TaxID=2602289 RepID=A0A640VTC8_9RHOB|nr:hypothetical protein [Roseobacter cerasinus]GFE51289.1 hypothetical protein So717_30420 [Roseobacter cerasinus]